MLLDPEIRRFNLHNICYKGLYRRGCEAPSLMAAPVRTNTSESSRRLGTRSRQPTFSKFYRKRKKLMYSVKNSGARVLINILTQNIIPNHMLSLIRENNS